MGKWMKAIIYIIGSAFLTRLIPTSFFRNVDTMIHEFGHALVTLLLSGQVLDISLYADHSGVTRSLVSSGSAMIPIALSGYLTASLFAWFLFALYAKGRYRSGLISITIIALVSLVLFVRNEYGMLWLIGLLVANLLAVWIMPVVVQKYYLLLLSFLTLEESVFGPLTILILAWRNSDQAGDATLLARQTGLPALFWGMMFLLFSIWCGKKAIDAFTMRGKYRRYEKKPVHPSGS